MTTYLYIKTHTKTGLKYLGKTKQDPFKYRGSGLDWKAHLQINGLSHHTEILRECQSKEEVREWGLYYSRLYNILNAQDDFGNRIWANRIFETGGTESRVFSANHISNITKAQQQRALTYSPWNKGKVGYKHSKPHAGEVVTRGPQSDEHKASRVAARAATLASRRLN